MVYLKLRDIIEDLENKLGAKAELDMQFFTEYIFKNVSESKLLEYGFKYKDHINNIPMYEYHNLVAYYQYGVLNIYESIC